MNDGAGNLSKLPVFFIVGRGRSGSTLLRTILDAHPAIVIPHESRFVQYLYYQYGTCQSWTPELAKKAADFTEQCFKPLQINLELFEKLIVQEKEALSFASVCKAIYLSTPSEFIKETITCIGDKNPRYSFFIPNSSGSFRKQNLFTWCAITAITFWQLNVLTKQLVKPAGCP